MLGSISAERGTGQRVKVVVSSFVSEWSESHLFSRVVMSLAACPKGLKTGAKCEK